MQDIILIIDDAREDLDLFQAMLEQHGYMVTRAYDGQEGLQKIKEDSPMIVVSDVMMPHMNGYALLKEIRHDQTIAKIPVLIVTARPKMADALLEIGADSFIAKPIDGNKFLSEVDKLVNRVKSSRLDGKRTVIFGRSGKILGDMRQQLEKIGCIVVDVKEEGQIVASIEDMGPDLFFLSVNAETKIPADLLVHILNTWSLPRKINKDQDVHKAPVKMRIILYEEGHGEAEPIWISSAEENYLNTDDKKAFLHRCYDNGAVGSIGTYSPQTFLSKVQILLHLQE